MSSVAKTRARIALATSILTVIAAASAQEVDERARAAADLERAPWAEPEGAYRPAEIQDPSLLRQSLPEIEFPIFDDVGDGGVWVLGRNYKARIDAAGLTFVPFLGSRAPRNFPVSLSLASATIGDQALPLHFQAQPVRDGQRIWVDHGSITEVFDVAADSIEQSFVVHRGSGLGDLDVRLGVETDMRQTMNGLGTWFSTPAGGVRYGLATTLDADGSELITTSLPVDRAVEFVVPAAEVARARGDLTIDPILATVNLEPSMYLDDRDPDVAYDASNDRYIVAFERVYSANDHDIFCQMVAGATGQPIPNTWTYIDFTWSDWRRPSVANMNNMDQFLVAASVGPAPKVIKCRTRFAATLGMGPQFTLNHNVPSTACDGLYPYNAVYTVLNDLTPVVGGDTWPGAGTSLYCVAWIRNKVFTLSGGAFDTCADIMYCTVTANGVASAPQFVASTAVGGSAGAIDGSQISLAISKSDGDPFSGGSQDWNLVYNDSNLSIVVNQIHWNGILRPSFCNAWSFCSPLPGSTSCWSPYSRISVSSSQANSSRKLFVTWDAIGASGMPRIYGVVVDPIADWFGWSPSVAYDLTGLQEQVSGVQFSGQWQPSVDCDGTNFVVAFNAYPDGTTGMAAAEFGDITVFKKGVYYTFFRCLEPQAKVAISNFAMGRSHMCAENSGGGARRNMLIGCTNWGGWGSGGYYGGDPLVALHTH